MYFIFNLMRRLGFAKFTIKYFICVTNLNLVYIAGSRRPGLPIPTTSGLPVACVWYLLAADSPDRDGQSQLAAGCLALDYQFQLAAC